MIALVGRVVLVVGEQRVLSLLTQHCTGPVVSNESAEWILYKLNVHSMEWRDMKRNAAVRFLQRTLVLSPALLGIFSKEKHIPNGPP